MAQDLNYGIEIPPNTDQRDNCISEKYHNPSIHHQLSIIRISMGRNDELREYHWQTRDCVRRGGMSHPNPIGIPFSPNGRIMPSPPGRCSTQAFRGSVRNYPVYGMKIKPMTGRGFPRFSGRRQHMDPRKPGLTE